MSLGARLALFYACYFVVLGVQVPYLPLWLAHRGLGEAEIGVLLAACVFVRLLTPLWGSHADRLDRRRSLVRALCGFALLACTLYLPARGFWPLLGVALLFNLALSAILPLAESMAVLADRQGRARYGPIRTLGSVAFLITALAVGPLLEGAGVSRLVALLIGAVALTLLAALALPEVQAGARAEPPARGRAPATLLLRSVPFRWFLLATAAAQGSHATLHASASLHWQAHGIAESQIAILWGIGVAVEIVLFTWGGAAMRRLGAVRLSTLAGIAVVVRWSITAATDEFAILCGSQALHGLTYGAAHLAAMRFLGTAVPPACASTAQTLYSALSLGAAVGCAGLVSSALVAHHVEWGFLAMAALGAVCLFATWRQRRCWREGQLLELDAERAPSLTQP